MIAFGSVVDAKKGAVEIIVFRNRGIGYGINT